MSKRKKGYVHYKQNRLPRLIAITVFLFILCLATVNPDENGLNGFFVCLLICSVSIDFLYFLIKQVQKERYLNSPIGKIDQMSGEDFEEYLAAHFEKLGYKVKLTQASNDYGCDLQLKKDGKITIVQAKRYKNKVANSAIQEIVAAKPVYGADYMMVVTNSYFTQNAINLANTNNVILWDRDTLKKEFKISY